MGVLNRISALPILVLVAVTVLSLNYWMEAAQGSHLSTRYVKRDDSLFGYFVNSFVQGSGEGDGEESESRIPDVRSDDVKDDDEGAVGVSSLGGLLR